MKNAFLLLTVLFTPVSALALSDQALVEACLAKGKQKLAAQSQAYGCQVNPEKAVVESIDNRFFNPSKYVWYKVDEPCGEFDQLVVMVQYCRGRCF